MSIIKNNKGISELTSFSLLTLLTITTALIAYTIGVNYMESKFEEVDAQNMEYDLYNINNLITQLHGTSGTGTYTTSFATGALQFENNTINFFSNVDYSSTLSICKQYVCTESVNGKKVHKLFIPYNLTVTNNYALEKGTHTLTFTVNKNANTVQVKINV